jgi:ribonuclease BN (tRNA processing enzyme)
VSAGNGEHRDEGGFSRRTLVRATVLGAGTGALLAGPLASLPAAASNAGPSSREAANARRGATVILLGTAGGPPPEPGRTGISTALVVDGVTYLIDCGRSSVTQYLQSGLAFASLRTIFLTHLHADHVADFYNYFMLAGFGKNQLGDGILQPVRVYGPGPAGALPPPYGGGQVPTVDPADPTPGTAELIKFCIGAFAYSTNLFMRDSGMTDVRTLIRASEIAVPQVGASPLGPTAPAMAPFPVMEDDRVKVSAILVPHGPVFPSFAFRFETEYGSFTHSGDTAYSDNVVTLAQGSDLLVHEAIDLAAFAGAPPALLNHLAASHTDVTKVGSIAERAGVPVLALTHLAPVTVPGGRWESQARNGYHGRVVVGTDLLTLPVGAGRH